MPNPTNLPQDEDRAELTSDQRNEILTAMAHMNVLDLVGMIAAGLVLAKGQLSPTQPDARTRRMQDAVNRAQAIIDPLMWESPHA